MRVLWLCNTLIGEIATEYGMPLSKPESWLKGIYECIKDRDDIDVLYLFPALDNNISFKKFNFEFRSYKQLSVNKMELDQIEYFGDVINGFNPDIIHVFGTELPHTYMMIKACEKVQKLDRVIVGIQGLVHIIAKYYYAYLPHKEILFPTIRDIYRSESYIDQKRAFENRGELEKEVLRSVSHIIGRTDWDKKHTYEINPSLNYHFCNEILRDSFYNCPKWKYESCEKHSIFVSQSNYPIKGFHLMLQALVLIKKKYPDVVLYTTGDEPYADSLIKIKRQKSYCRYISKFIKKHKLQNNISFLGYLDERSMCNRFLKSHVFVSPSVIENSPNSVGEAMIIGVPTISTDVGGVRNQLADHEDGLLYSPREVTKLAQHIEKLFEDIEYATYLSKNAIVHAERTYNREINTNRLIEIYNEVRLREI